MAQSGGSSDSDNEPSSAADDASVDTPLVAARRHPVNFNAEDQTWTPLHDSAFSTPAPQVITDVSEDDERTSITNDGFTPNDMHDLLATIREDTANEEVGGKSPGGKNVPAEFSSYAATQTMTTDKVAQRATAAATLTEGQENAHEEVRSSGAGAMQPELQHFLLQQKIMLQSSQPANMQQQAAFLAFQQRQQQTQQQAEIQRRLQALQSLGSQHQVRTIAQAQAQSQQQGQAQQEGHVLHLPVQLQNKLNLKSTLQAALATSQQQQIHQLSSLEGAFTDGTGTPPLDRSTLTSYAATVDLTRELEKKLLLVKEQNKALALQLQQSSAGTAKNNPETLAPQGTAAGAAISKQTKHAPVPTNGGGKCMAGNKQSDTHELLGFVRKDQFQEMSKVASIPPSPPPQCDAKIESRKVPCSSPLPEDQRKNKHRLVIPGPDLPLGQSSLEMGSRSDPTRYANNINRTKLDALDCIIRSMPREETEEFLDAQNNAPELANTDEHKMKFLWHDDLMERVAATRMARYWKKRYELFGRDVALQRKIMLDDIPGTMPLLRQGLFRSMPGTDKRGRSIQYLCPEILAAHTDPREMGKVIWYACNLASDDHPGPSEHPGVVILGDLRNFQLPHLAACYRMYSYLKSVRECLPYETKALHLFLPSDFPWWDRIFPEILKNFIMPHIERDRIVIHTGTSGEGEGFNLGQFGIHSGQIPRELGGDVSLDDWRRFLEQKVKQGRRSLDESVMSLEQGRSANGTKQEASAKAGRKSNPRMDRAVEEKLSDPDMTLLEALEKGGFVFDHQFDKPGMNDSKVFDAADVSLRQRKNQLNRRLRKAAEK